MYLPRIACAQIDEVEDYQARTEFNAGRDAFNREDYDEAIHRFERSYELSQRPQLLYNLGTTYDRLHRWRLARDAFQRYLVAFPDAAERSEVLTRLEAINAEIHHEEELEARRQRERPTVALAPVVNPGAPSVPGKPHPWFATGLTFGGLALVSGGASLTLALLSNAKFDQLWNTCSPYTNPDMPQGCPQREIDDLKMRATAINILLVGAIAFAVTSVASFLVNAEVFNSTPVSTAQPQAQRTPRRSLRASFVPLTTLNGSRPVEGGILSLSGSF